MDIVSSIAHVTPVVAYITVFFLMIANGASNLPSSQLLYLFVGYLTTQGNLSLYLLALCGGIGNAIGNIFLYEVVRVKGSDIIKSIFSLETTKQHHVKELLERHGAMYIFLGKLIPGVKVFIPVVAGLTKIPRSLVYFTLTSSSILWAIMFLHIGAFFGTNTEFTKWYGIFAVFVFFVLYIYTYKKYPHLFSASNTLSK